MSAVGAGSEERVRAGRRTLTVHRPDKVLYPDDGLTKGEVVGYYRGIAPHMVPHLRDRPLMLERDPEGVGEQPHFMQKNAGAHYPDWVRRAPMSKEGGGTVDHPVCDDTATLVYLADQAVLTFHRWLSTVGDPRHPDLLVFDLDPPGDDFAAVREAALRFRDLLAEVELDPLLMTTGSRGLHLVVRLDGRAGYDTVRAFAQDAAELSGRPLILREEGSGTRQVLAEAVGGLAAPLLELSSTTALKAAVASGAGPAVLSELVVSDELAAGRLVKIPVAGVRLTRELRAVWPAGHPPVGPARDLLGLTRGGRG